MMPPPLPSAIKLMMMVMMVMVMLTVTMVATELQGQTVGYPRGIQSIAGNTGLRVMMMMMMMMIIIVLGHHVLFGIDPIQHRVHVPLQPRQQFRIAPHQLRAAHVQRHQLLQRHQRFVVRARPEVVVPGHPAVRLYRQLVHQRAQHAREHEQRVLQCLIGRLGALQMEQRHRVRVGHVRQLGQIVRCVPLLVQRHQPVVLLRPDRVVVDDQDHGQRVVHRIERQYQLGDLERRPRAGPRLQMLPVFEQRDEEGPILLPPVVQPAVALRQAEHRVKGRLEGEQRVLDQLRRHRVIVRHLAQLAQLNERVHVVRVLVDDAYDVLRVHALDRVEELLLHLPVRGAVLERKVDDVLVEDGLRPGGGRRHARFRRLHQVHVDA
uniref:Secreted protein n=1 Tax=Anopheles melas TaxID=34690 RepID=A0A182TH63_9DIPT